jgi:hypothetical protein
MTQGGPSVLVDPNQINVFKGEVFNASVDVSSVTDLLGWEFQLYWNNSVLNCTNVAVQTPSAWQNHTQNFGAGLEPNYNATCACYWQAQAGTYPASSFNGSMTIVTLTFQARALARYLPFTIVVRMSLIVAKNNSASNLRLLLHKRAWSSAPLHSSTQITNN